MLINSTEHEPTGYSVEILTIQVMPREMYVGG